MFVMKEKKLIILGAGGYGRTVADVAAQLGYSTMFLDDSIPDHPLSSFAAHIHPDSKASTSEGYFIPAFGNNQLRLSWLDTLSKAGAMLATLIHPTAYVSPKAQIGEGVVILPKACVNTDTIVEKGCILNIGCIVDHGCVIEEGVHICLGAIVKGENRVKALSKIEAGQVIEARTYPIS